MIWMGVSIAGVVVALVAVLGRRLTRRKLSAAQPVDDVDPLFTIGIVTGTGGALATSVDLVMFGVMAAGLILMTVGATRTRRHPNH